MTAKLNQIIAVLNGAKSRSKTALTDIYHKIQKESLFQGLCRTYQKLKEEDQDEPGEKQLVQFTTLQIIEDAEKALSEMLDLTSIQDATNCVAKADVKIDGKTILPQVPVTTLLFIEKQLIDLHTFFSKLPTLAPELHWSFDETTNTWKSDETRTNRTKKIMKSLVKYEATKEHPAQTEVYSEDVKVGEWKLTKFSGAMPTKSQSEILERITKLQSAVKFAREEANNIEITEKRIAKPIFDYVIRSK